MAGRPPHPPRAAPSPRGWLGLATLWLAVAVVALLPLPEVARALALVPAFFWLSGRGLARRLGGDRVLVELHAVWISVVAAVPIVALARLTELDGVGVFVGFLLLHGVGEATAPAVAVPPPDRAQRLGLAAGALAVGVTGVAFADTLTLPLSQWWYTPHIEADWGSGRAPVPANGWEIVEALGGEGALRLAPASPVATVESLDDPVLVVFHAPVGAHLRVQNTILTIEASPTEDPDEGPVRRYRRQGIASTLLPASPGATVRFAFDVPAESRVTLLPSLDALWSLEGEGQLRFAHYYQLLNMVEQLDWATELGFTRWVTDVQPPLWSYVLAAPLLATGGGLPTANVLLLLLLAALCLAGMGALRAFAPDAPTVAMLLPAAAVYPHARLLLVPGSGAMPDTLYSLAILCAVATLAPAGGGFARYALLAQLTRYPGAGVAVIAAAFARDRGAAARAAGLVGAAIAAFGLGGWLSGSLPGWIETVTWETGPEHWHGETDPGTLLGRTPRFYGLWLAYTGGLPLLALTRWPRGTRIALGTAAVYSLLLCTIDHTPSHYFLPLLHLSVLACGCTAAALPRPWGTALAAVGLATLSISLTLVPIVG